jgi:hypothetical protein
MNCELKRSSLYVPLLSFLLLAAGGKAAGATTDSSGQGDSLSSSADQGDSVRWMRVTDRREKRRLQQLERRLHRDLNGIDTTYIEPQRFNFTTMVQSVTTYELYRLSSKEGQSITFAPAPTLKLGPYFGWRWIFFGYTIDVAHLGGKNSARKEYDVSIYSSRIGVDLFYRQTGNDYKIRRINLGNAVDTRPLEGMPFGGVSSTVKGFNVYYIFNFRRFSYPAAFSQSTVQRRSAGSPLIGIGYTRHELSVNWEDLDRLVADKLGRETVTGLVNNDLLFGKVKYTDVALSGGYAYNYVPCRNWLLAASLSLAVAYKRTTGDNQRRRFSLRDFSFDNINIDGIGRFAIVYNNMRWYAGANAVLHAYNYHKSQFSTNNIFGALNVYVGFNFGRKRK